MWLHSLKVAQLLPSAACLHTDQSRSYLNHLVLCTKSNLLTLEKNLKRLTHGEACCFNQSAVILTIIIFICNNVGRGSPVWTVRGSSPGGSEFFRLRPDLPCGPPSLMYNWHRVSFPVVNRPGLGVDHPPLSSAEVRERVELYLCAPTQDLF